MAAAYRVPIPRHTAWVCRHTQARLALFWILCRDFKSDPLKALILFPFSAILILLLSLGSVLRAITFQQLRLFYVPFSPNTSASHRCVFAKFVYILFRCSALCLCAAYSFLFLRKCERAREYCTHSSVGYSLTIAKSREANKKAQTYEWHRKRNERRLESRRKATWVSYEKIEKRQQILLSDRRDDEEWENKCFECLHVIFVSKVGCRVASAIFDAYCIPRKIWHPKVIATSHLEGRWQPTKCNGTRDTKMNQIACTLPTGPLCVFDTR